MELSKANDYKFYIKQSRIYLFILKCWYILYVSFCGGVIMKKKMSVLILAVFALTLFVALPAGVYASSNSINHPTFLRDIDDAPIGYIVITDPDPNGANIRRTPDRSSNKNIITTALKGTQFPFYSIEQNAKTKENYFKLMLPDGRYGYVRTSIAKIYKDVKSTVLGIIEITDPDPNGANIRRTPDRSSNKNIITTALKGAQFPFYGKEQNAKTKENYYVLTLPDGRYGYVRTSIAMIYQDFNGKVLGIIEITDPDPNGANIRSTPDRSSNSNIIRTALKGTQFPFYGKERNASAKEDYYKLLLPDGRYGYVRTSIAKIVSDY